MGVHRPTGVNWVRCLVSSGPNDRPRIMSLLNSIKHFSDVFAQEWLFSGGLGFPSLVGITSRLHGLM